MTARSRMTHRALIERDGATGSDPYNAANVPSWATHIASLSCWFYVPRGRQPQVTTDAATVTLEQPRLLAPKGTDIAEGDRINGIVDRLGASVYSGILNITSVVPKPTHLELVCEQVGQS